MNAHSRTLLTVICEAALEKRLLDRGERVEVLERDGDGRGDGRDPDASDTRTGNVRHRDSFPLQVQRGSLPNGRRFLRCVPRQRG